MPREPVVIAYGVRPRSLPYLKKGKFDKTYKSKITISTPGTYGICVYLQYGSKTKKHAASSFTITQS